MTVNKNLFVDTDKNNLIGSAILNTNTYIVIADEIVFSFLGTSISVPLIDYIHPDFKQQFTLYVENCMDTPTVFATKCKRYDGQYVDVSVILQNKLIDDKPYISIDMFDVLYLTKEYKNLVVNHKIFETIINLSDKILFQYNLDTKEIHIYNKKNTIFFGSLELYRTTLLMSKGIAPESIQQFHQMCDNIAAANGDGFFKFNSTIFNNNGDTNFYSTIVNFSTIELNSQVAYVVGMFVNDDNANSFTSYTSSRSNLDPLTGLLNKKAIKDYALEALSNAQQTENAVTFLVIDLDNFKTINDTYGHMFGDDTLVSVARVLNETVGDRGVVGRIGGDEFFIVLTTFPDGKESIRPLLRSIRSHVEWCFKNKLDDIKITCSIGTASYPADAIEYDDLFKLADHCLYVAKSKGRDRFITYTRSMHGSLDEIVQNGTVIQMANFISETDKSKHLLTIIDRFNNASTYDQQQVILKKIFLELLYYYDLDGVQYISVNDNIHYEAANYALPTDISKLFQLYIDNNEMLTRDCMKIGNYENAQIEHPVVYEYMISAGMYSAAIFTNVVNGQLNGLFISSTHKRYQKWASFDTRTLSIIFKLMERFINA